MTPSLALCMLVYDDEGMLEQSLTSVLELIDYWVICDAGLNDRVGEIVSEVLAGIPGELHRSEWVDFGHNRSELMQLAEGKADYLLLLDADMTLARSGPLPELVDDAYIVREIGGDATGAPRVVDGSRPWWFEGSVREVLATNGRYSEAELDALAIERHADDASRTRQLLRQLAILERDAAIETTPAIAFNLAQTLQTLGKTGPAIEWFRHRVNLGGPAQETFYANFQEGVLRATVNFPSAVPVLLEAWQRRPTRAEPLHELARSYRQRGDTGLAYHFANFGLQIRVPTDALFVHRWVYEWGLRFERGWAAGRLGRVEEAVDDLHEVLRADGVPADYVEVVQGWLEELAQDAGRPAAGSSDGRVPAPLASLLDGVRTGRVHLDVSPRWPIFNPSIASDGDGFSMIVRSQNIGYDDGRLLIFEDPQRNINHLVKLNATLAVRSADRLEGSKGIRGFEVSTVGLMDIRLIQVNGSWCGLGNTWKLSSDKANEMALVRLEGTKMVSINSLVGPDPDRREKNWMPFVREDQLHFVYSCAPMTIFRHDIEKGLTLVAQSESPRFASAFRGGSQGLPLDDGGYLFVVHETYLQEARRCYLHRFIRVDPELRLSAVSRPFTFVDDVREFCAGAAVCGSDLVLSFGVRHTEAWLALVPLASVLNLLEPITQS